MNLVIGAGQLGLALQTVSEERGIDSKVIPHSELDITDFQSVKQSISRWNPSRIFITAAMTGVDQCEVEPKSRAVNVQGVRNIMTCAADAQVTFFSSSYVFDGTKSTPYVPADKPIPLQMYGVQKVVAEKVVMENIFSQPGVVIRTSGMFGYDPKRKNFVYQVYDALKAGQKFLAPVDQWLNFVYTKHVAQFALRCTQSGIHHIGGTKNLTKYEWAKWIANKLELDETKVIGVPTYKLGQLATRPRNGCLMSEVPYDPDTAMETFKYVI